MSQCQAPGGEVRARVTVAARPTATASRLKGIPIFVLAAVALLLCMLAIGALSSMSAPSAGATSCRIVGSGKSGGAAPGETPPPELLPIYRRATEKYGLGPRGPGILAAINFVETSFGTNMNNTTGSGAMGWMMFMPETWATYGVDANRDGKKDPYDPEDAIYAAARYLHASGAPGNWHDAIFAYNHAEWYVERVLEAESKFSGEVVCAPAPAAGPLGQLPAGEVERLEYVANWIEAKRLPYCWGGGHGAKPGPSGGSYCWNANGEKIFGSIERGLDCSGAVRWLLVLAGYPDPGPIASGGFIDAYPIGFGMTVTIWSNAEHVFITINGRDWGTSETNFAHGPGWASHTKSGFLASHLPNL